jgi:hypothetical protein
MHSKWLSLSAALVFGAIAVGFKLDVSNPQLKSHVDALQKAPSLTVTFTVNTIGTGIEDEKLTVSKPGLVRWETPAKIVIANGTSILTFNKKDSTYTEEDQTKDSLRNLFKADPIWAWSAVWDDAFLKPVTDAKTGSSRRVKADSVKEVTVVVDKKTRTLLIDDKLGFARGTTYTTGEGGATTVLVVASEIEVGKDALMASDKAFGLPAGAKKVEKSAATLTYADVAPILAANCRCHGAGPKGGLSLGSYAALMRGGNSGPAVVPGNPDGSILIQVIKGTRPPKMPPQGSVPSDKIDILAKWIADGAKE